MFDGRLSAQKSEVKDVKFCNFENSYEYCKMLSNQDNDENAQSQIDKIIQLRQKQLCLVPPEFIKFLLNNNQLNVKQLPHSYDVWCLGLILLEIIEGFPIECVNKS